MKNKKVIKIIVSILFIVVLMIASLSACGRGAKEVEPDDVVPEVTEAVEAISPAEDISPAPAVKAEADGKSPAETKSPAVSPSPVESSAPAQTPSVSTPSTSSQKPSTPNVGTQIPSAPSAPSTSNQKPSTPSTPSHTHNWVANTTTVHHDAVGHYETKVIKEAWIEQTPTTYTYYCKCGAEFATEAELGAHSSQYYWDWDESINHNSGGKHIHPGQPIYHEAVTENVWVVDKPAYDETVTTYTCSCGAKK